MIVTPSGFMPLIDPVDHDAPVTFAFRGNELLIRDPDAALPEGTTVSELRIAPGSLHPVGLWDGRYCRAAWLPRDATPPAGHAFKGLRALFGRFDEPTLAVAGRAFQIADWARTHQFCGACGEPM